MLFLKEDQQTLLVVDVILIFSCSLLFTGAFYMHFPLIFLIFNAYFCISMLFKEVIGELMAVRRNLTATLASLVNVTTQLDLARATIQDLNNSTVANFTLEVGLYSGYAAVGLTGAARLAWLQWQKDKVFPLDR